MNFTHPEIPGWIVEVSEGFVTRRNLELKTRYVWTTLADFRQYAANLVECGWEVMA